MNKYTCLDVQKGHEYCFFKKKKTRLADLSNELCDRVQKRVETSTIWGSIFYLPVEKNTGAFLVLLST